VNVKIEALKNEGVGDFIDYCRKHRIELDDSFINEEDLKGFEPNEENPTYIITSEEGEVIAAASLIIDEYNRRGRKARFRILHSELEDIQHYKMLMQAILKHTEGLDKVFLFIPVINKKIIEFIEGLKFVVERYSCVLVIENTQEKEIILPGGYEIRPFRAGIDEKVWCEVRNSSFASLKGSETPVTPEMITKMISEEDYIHGGLMILYHREKAVGVVRGSKEEYENSLIMNIGPLAIIPEYQNRGLGRSLLRASLNFSRSQGFKKSILCVNSDNDIAKALYIGEGFREMEAVVCYKYDLI
jgi:mycothiol synthase